MEPQAATTVEPGSYITFKSTSPLKDNWVRLPNITNLDEAQRCAEAYYPDDYSMVYNQARFEPRYFPGGELKP